MERGEQEHLHAASDSWAQDLGYIGALPADT